MSCLLFGTIVAFLLLSQGGDAYERCEVVADDGTLLGFNICERELVCCEKNKAECCDTAGNVQNDLPTFHELWHIDRDPASPSSDNQEMKPPA